LLDCLGHASALDDEVASQSPSQCEYFVLCSLDATVQNIDVLVTDPCCAGHLQTLARAAD
jgi:hypothetical protein